MKKKLGDKLSQKLKSRLFDLQAAPSVSDLVAGRPHPLKHDKKGKYAVDLDNMWRLVFEAANDPLPKNSDETVDWKRVTMVRITNIEDYHE